MALGESLKIKQAGFAIIKSGFCESLSLTNVVLKRCDVLVKCKLFVSYSRWPFFNCNDYNNTLVIALKNYIKRLKGHLPKQC